MKGATAFLVGLVFLVSATFTAGLAANSTAIQVTVTATDGKPVADASVYLRPEGGSAFPPVHCDARGVAVLRDIPEGLYALRVFAVGYEAFNEVLDVRDGDQQISLGIILAKQLQTIARVHSKINSERRVLRRDEGLGKISTSLISLMNMAGGISIQTGPDGSIRGVSLHGEDPTLTTTSFDGVTLNGSVALQALDPDLLQTAQVDDADDSVDFESMGPSAYPIYDAREMLSGFAGREFLSTAQGTAGKVGFAGEFVTHGQESDLTNGTYLDTSGLNYDHTGGYNNAAVDAKIYFPFSDNVSAHAEEMIRSSHQRPIETFEAGDLPQGFGPGNATDLTSSISTLSFDAYAGQWVLHATELNLQVQNALDYRDSIVAGTPFPQLSHALATTNALSFSAMEPLPDSTMLNLNFSDSISRSQLDELIGGFAGSLPQSNGRNSELSAEMNVNTTRGAWAYSLDNNYSHQTAPQIANVLDEVLDVTWNHKATQLFGTFEAGTKLGPPLDIEQFDAPSEAEYNCSGGTVIANAPNDQPGTPHQLSATLGTSTTSGAGSFSASGYFHAFRGMTLTQALVAAQSTAPGFLPPGYISGLQDGFTTFGGCSPLTGTLPQVYIEQDIAGVGVDYSGFDINASRRFGKHLSTQFALGYHRAILVAGDQRVQSPLSPYVIGRQVPLVPPIQLSLTGDYRLGGRDEILANISGFSSNNDHNLPAYATITIGAVRQLSSVMALTAIAANAGRSFVGDFSSPQFAVPLISVTGTPVPTIATPLLQPNLYVVLRFRLERTPPDDL